MPQSCAQFLNLIAVKGEPKSVMIRLGIPKWCKMSWMNSTTFVALYFMSDFVLDPLGELIDCDEDIFKTTFRFFKWTHLV
jgi:hypothetical protein